MTEATTPRTRRGERRPASVKAKGLLPWSFDAARRTQHARDDLRRRGERVGCALDDDLVGARALSVREHDGFPLRGRLRRRHMPPALLRMPSHSRSSVAGSARGTHEEGHDLSVSNPSRRCSRPYPFCAGAAACASRVAVDPRVAERGQVGLLDRRQAREAEADARLHVLVRRARVDRDSVDLHEPAGQREA